MFNGSFFEPTRVVVKEMDGRYRLVYEGTGNLFLNLIGGPVDGGGYDTEREAVIRASRFNMRLPVVLKRNGFKPISARAVAMMR